MAGCTILLTNDDGFEAPGLVAAYEAVRGLGDVHVVAPLREQSGCGHSITLGKPIAVERRERAPFGSVFAVHGSPADCVRLAYAELVGGPIDLVVSGVNRGANAGIDVFYSGTVAAAREGAFLGIRSISLSQAVRSGVDIDWTQTGRVAAGIVRELLTDSLPGAGFWSVNLPSPIPADWRSSVQTVPVATHPVPMSFERVAGGDERTMSFRYGASYWSREESGKCDYNVVRDGGIAISRIPLFATFSDPAD